jgi:hypothetical protein
VDLFEPAPTVLESLKVALNILEEPGETLWLDGFCKKLLLTCG